MDSAPAKTSLMSLESDIQRTQYVSLFHSVRYEIFQIWLAVCLMFCEIGFFFFQVEVGVEHHEVSGWNSLFAFNSIHICSFCSLRLYFWILLYNSLFYFALDVCNFNLYCWIGFPMWLGHQLLVSSTRMVFSWLLTWEVSFYTIDWSQSVLCFFKSICYMVSLPGERDRSLKDPSKEIPF